MSEAVPPLDLDDVQGTLVRGYRVDYARHLVLRVVDPSRARRFLGSLVDEAEGIPHVTRATDWGEDKPESFLNVGLTCSGLRRLGVDPAHLETFPEPFRRGASADITTERVGDVGESGPSEWISGLADDAAVNVILSLWVTRSEQERNRVTAVLRRAFAGALEEVTERPLDAATLPTHNRNGEHFGYADGIAQPVMEGAPSPKHQRGEVTAGKTVPREAVLLGPDTLTPAQLSQNSSFAAFRVLKQDVAAFERFLDFGAAQAGVDKEVLAAKICGRWRNGVPLALSPDTPQPDPPVPREELDAFDYAEDPSGYVCPVGSHIRRARPRSQAVRGGAGIGHRKRLVRRGMPYGPPFDPQNPDDEERGLVGYFITAHLRDFEFVMSEWMHDAGFVMSKPQPDGSNPHDSISGYDPFSGGASAEANSFTLSMPGAGGGPPRNQVLTGFSRFVTTRGGAYVFLPSITGLQYLARL